MLLQKIKLWLGSKIHKPTKIVEETVYPVVGSIKYSSTLKEYEVKTMLMRQMLPKIEGYTNFEVIEQESGVKLMQATLFVIVREEIQLG